MNIFPALKDFLDASPTSFHAASAISEELESSGYIKLDEKDSWKLKRGQGYFIVREGRAVIAFIPGSSAPAESGLRIAAAHLDSPVWKVKTEGAALEKGVWRLPVEPYGSPIYSTWVDRELEIAGMVTYRDSNSNSSSLGEVISKSWRSGGPTVIIPSLAIHFNKEINKGIELNPQNHMAAVLPVNEYAEKSNASEPDTNPVIARFCTDLGISESDYLASELYLVPSDKASFLGTDKNQLIVSGRLDNLAMSYAILESLPDFNSVGDSGVLAFWFDAEEVGSRTSSGASSIFPDEIIERIVLSFKGGREDLIRCRRNSFLVSVDMAHAVHPNYSDRHDPSYMPEIGSGPVIKSHGLKKYATDVFSETHIIDAAEKAGVKLQKLIFRSDLSCGSTVGPITSSSLSISAVDIGNPMWAMHSARETASMSDHHDMVKLLRECWKL